MSEIPQWAWDEARRRSGHSAIPCPAMDELARMIAEHEEPPVDPLLVEAREIVKATFDPGSHSRCDCREKIDAGKMDGGHRIRATLAALKRGMELAREANHG